MKWVKRTSRMVDWLETEQGWSFGGACIWSIREEHLHKFRNGERYHWMFYAPDADEATVDGHTLTVDEAKAGVLAAARGYAEGLVKQGAALLRELDGEVTR